MKNLRFDFRLFVAVSLILLSIATRFLELPPNFSPLIAVALLSGSLFSNRKFAIMVPIIAMFVSDIFLGLHSTMIGVYLSFGIVVLLGSRIKHITIKNVLLNSIAGGVVFFLLTNLAVWMAGWYGYSFSSLTLCYEMAIPFFRNTLSSSVLYSAVLFGGVYAAERLQPSYAKI